MPNYTLNYFNGRGRAELTRLIFAAGGVAFTDTRLEFADWPAHKAEAPIGQMPFLDVDGTKLPQSIAIARFAARECNLTGANNFESAQADAIVDTVIDLVNFYYKNIFGIQDEAAKATAFQAFIADQGTKGATNIEKLISLYGSNGFAVGSSLTWADLIIYDLSSALFAKVPSFSAGFPLLTAIHDSVAKNERVAAYVAARPVTPF